MSIQPKAIFRFKIPIKIPISFFTEIEQGSSGCINHKRLQVGNLRKNKAESITLPDLKQFYKVIVIKQCGIGIKRTHRSIQNRNESPEINQCIYNLILTKKDKNMGKGQSLQ